MVASSGRSVVEGAFELLEALSRASNGVGLSELARESNLPKATAHRLLEQLIARGAVQRDNHRYYIGATMARLGRGWQPDPALRRASNAPCRTLARLTGAVAVVCVLEGDDLRVVTASGSVAQSTYRMSVEDELVVRTAAAQVLLAGRSEDDLPVGYTRPEWKRVRGHLSNHTALAVDHQDILPGVFCFAGAIPSPRSGQIASLSIQFINQTPPRGTAELVARAAREATRTLACQ